MIKPKKFQLLFVAVALSIAGVLFYSKSHLVKTAYSHNDYSSYSSSPNYSFLPNPDISEKKEHKGVLVGKILINSMKNAKAIKLYYSRL